MKHENPRTDIATRKPYPRDMLLRLVTTGSGLVVDHKGDMPGRGYYLLKDEKSLEIAVKKKVFERILHRPLTPEEAQAIKEAL